MNSKNKIKNYKGFSFIEGIISVFLISVGMIAVLALMSANLRETFDSRDQTIATLLSQEGIELVRNLRDNNWANGEPAFDSAEFPGGGTGYRIDYRSGSVRSTNPIRVLNVNANGYYWHSAGSATKFQRKIEIDYFNANNGPTSRSGAFSAKIKSVVSWGEAGLPATTATDANCNSATKCAYTETILSKWGGS